jgi:hypothetical protein
MLKRLSIVFLAVAFVASATMQLMPHVLAAAADADAAVPCDMIDMRADAAPAGVPEMPCKGMIPVCSDSIGCAVVVDLPRGPQASPVAVRWTPVAWSAAERSLAGLTIEPELTPPIAIA